MKLSKEQLIKFQLLKDEIDDHIEEVWKSKRIDNGNSFIEYYIEGDYVEILVEIPRFYGGGTELERYNTEDFTIQ